MGDGRVVLGLCLGVYNLPSIFTLYASPVKSYGGGAGVVFFCGAKPPASARTSEDAEWRHGRHEAS